ARREEAQLRDGEAALAAEAEQVEPADVERLRSGRGEHDLRRDGSELAARIGQREAAAGAPALLDERGRELLGVRRGLARRGEAPVVGDEVARARLAAARCGARLLREGLGELRARQPCGNGAEVRSAANPRVRRELEERMLSHGSPLR